MSATERRYIEKLEAALRGLLGKSDLINKCRWCGQVYEEEHDARCDFEDCPGNIARTVLEEEHDRLLNQMGILVNTK
jgi:hypothetical protein